MTKLSSKPNSGKGSRATRGEPAKSTPRIPVVARAFTSPPRRHPKHLNLPQQRSKQ